MKLILQLILLSVILSCSNMSENVARHHHFEMKSGRFEKNTWTDSIIFHRTSWYQELSLVFDIFLYRIDATSPFFQWFSDSEKEKITSCEESFVSLSYQIDTNKITQSNYTEEMQKNGFENFVLTEFKRNMQLHPVFDKQNLKLYKIQGFCLASSKRTVGDPIFINFPGFNTIHANY